MTSLIYMITPTTQNVTASGVLPLSTISRRTGCAIQNNSDSIVITKPGYYKVDISVVLTGQTTGDVTLDLQNNGVNVAGITSTETIATANTDVHTLSLTGIIRVFCNSGTAVLTLVNTGEVDITTTNVSFAVERID